MKLTKNYKVLYIVPVILLFSCSLNNNNQVTDDFANNPINDSVLNVQLRTMIDSTLSLYLHLQLDPFNITTSYTNNDTIKSFKGSGRSNRYGNEEFDIEGSYEVSQGLLSCKSLKVIHSDVGTVLAIFEKYDTLLTYRMDSVTFTEKNSEYVERRNEIWEDRINKVEYAYANRTKVHFGISKDEYNRLGEEFKRNFYEGLIDEGAYELAEPIFSSKNIFVGFKIRETHGKTFSYSYVSSHAKLVKKEQLGYDAHECFEYVYKCELYNMEIISRYDKFERRTNHSLKCYWNKY